MISKKDYKLINWQYPCVIICICKFSDYFPSLSFKEPKVGSLVRHTLVPFFFSQRKLFTKNVCKFLLRSTSTRSFDRHQSHFLVKMSTLKPKDMRVSTMCYTDRVVITFVKGKMHTKMVVES